MCDFFKCAKTVQFWVPCHKECTLYSFSSAMYSDDIILHSCNNEISVCTMENCINVFSNI